MARKVGVSQAAVVAVERSEETRDVTLTTLQRYGEAMERDVVYALVPRRPLCELVEAQAERVAREEIRRVRDSMALEGQATGTDARDRQVNILKRKLLEGRPSRLWQ